MLRSRHHHYVEPRKGKMLNVPALSLSLCLFQLAISLSLTHSHRRTHVLFVFHLVFAARRTANVHSNPKQGQRREKKLPTYIMWSTVEEDVVIMRVRPSAPVPSPPSSSRIHSMQPCLSGSKRGTQSQADRHLGRSDTPALPLT